MKIDGFETFVSLGKDNAEALVKSGNATLKGLEEVGKASQEYAAKSMEKADAAVKAIMAVKSPVELADLQGKFLREAVETAIAESRKIAEIGQSAFSAALEPLNARVAAFQALAKTAA